MTNTLRTPARTATTRSGATRRAGGLAVAGLATLAVGAGSLALGGSPAVAGEDPRPTSPTTIDVGALAGDAPATAYVVGHTVTFPTGETVELTEVKRIHDVAMIGDNVAVVHGKPSAPRLDVYAPTGEHVSGHRLDNSSIAVDETNTLLAFVGPRQRTVVLEDGGATRTNLPTAGAERPELGAVDGSSAADALVAVNDGGGARLVTAQEVQEFDYTVHDISDVHEILATTGMVAEMTSGGLISNGETQWERDEYGVRTFSEDDSRVLAGDNLAGGFSDTTLALLDAATGDSLAEFTTAKGLRIVDAAWEDSDHVLVSVAVGQDATAADSQNLLRVGVDGSVETVVTAEYSVRLAD